MVARSRHPFLRTAFAHPLPRRIMSREDLSDDVGSTTDDDFASFGSVLVFCALSFFGLGARIISTSHAGISGILPARNASMSDGAPSALRHSEPSGQMAPGPTTQPVWPRTLMPQPVSAPSWLPSGFPAGCRKY